MTKTTTKPPPVVLPGVCSFWGDPHVQTFDGARPSFYGDGEFSIVKSKVLHIQGRYSGTRYTKGLAATNKIAVGGVALHGHVIKVGTLESGELTVDGHQVCTTFPSVYDLNGIAKITYDSNGDLVDQATKIWERKIVHIELSMGVRITVFRWKNYLDLKIEMKPLPDQDGGCGNFNGDPSDDTTEAILSRVGARVLPGENLFDHRMTVLWTDTLEKLLAMAPKDRYAHAQAKCRTAWKGMTPSEVEMKSCILDFVYGSNEHTLRMATALGI